MPEPIRRFVIMRKFGDAPTVQVRGAGRTEIFETRRAAEERAEGLRIVSRYSDPFMDVTYWVEEVQR